MTDARNFLLNTDYQVPPIIKVYNLELPNVVSSDFGTAVESIVPHGLPFTPLPLGVWYDSIDNVWRDIANSRPGMPFSMPPLVESLVTSSTDVIGGVIDAKYPSGTVTTYKWKVALLTPPDYNGDINITNTYDTTNFMYSSDVESPKIFLFDTVTLNAGETIAIHHGLGYKPIVRVWDNKVASSGIEYIYTGLSAHQEAFRTDSDNLYLKSIYNNTKFYYMIWKD